MPDTIDQRRRSAGGGTTTPRERPILFSAPMVRAILADTKTQTRRIIKRATGAFWDHAGWRPVASLGRVSAWETTDGKTTMGAGAPMPLCPYGQPGDRLWVREAWRRPHCAPRTALEPGQAIQYRASGDWHDGFGEGWRPSIHMPRWASRLTLEITSIRVERVQDISEADAIAEGMIFTPRDKVSPGKVGPIGEEAKPYFIQPCQWSWRENATSDQSLGTARFAFANLWQHINGDESWAANPWVWVVGFRRITHGGAH